MFPQPIHQLPSGKTLEVALGLGEDRRGDGHGGHELRARARAVERDHRSARVALGRRRTAVVKDAEAVGAERPGVVLPRGRRPRAHREVGSRPPARHTIRPVAASMS